MYNCHKTRECKLMEQQLITEVIGYFGLLLALLALTFKNDLHFKISQTFSSLCFAIHVYLLDSYIGVITCGLGFLSLSIAIWKNNKKINNIFFGIYIILLIYAIYNFQLEQWYEILPAITNIFWITAFLYLSGQKANLMLLPVVLLWMLYAICVNSIPNLMTQFTVLLFLLRRIYRLSDINKKVQLI